jgi:cytochrome c oxidase subunit I+III
LWQHLFWLFGHPEVYIIFLPAAGAVSMMIPTFARHELVGYRAIVVSVIAVAFLSFGLWVHHMFTVGIPHLALSFFSAASGLVAIPTAVQIFAWIATIASGKPRFDVPMLYLAGFFFVFVMGGLTGVMLAMVPFNFQAHDTHFVVAHMHYVLVGGFVFPMLAGAYYWLPHVTGRVPDHRLSFAPAFWLIFTGFNLTFFMMHLTGLLGMPRRISTYPAEAKWDWLNLTSSIGGFIMAIGFAVFLIDVILHIKFGKRTAANPWKAPTLEWAMPLPAASYNFASIPQVSSRENTPDARATGLQLAKGEGYLGFARDMAQETLGVETTSGKIEYVIRLPRATYLPIITAAATGLFFISVLFKLYTLAVVGFVLTIFMLLAWTRTVGLRQDVGPVAIGNGETAVNHAEAPNPPSVWASGLAIAADATAFSSLAFGLLFLWVVAPNWPPPRLLDPDFTIFLTIVAGSIFAASCARRALHQSNAGQSGQREMWLAACALGQVIAGGALIACLFSIPDPVRHAYAATSFMLVAYMLLRSGFALLLTLFAFWRSRTGYVSVTRTMDLRICSMWQAHAAVTAAVGAGLVFGLPWTLIP